MGSGNKLQRQKGPCSLGEKKRKVKILCLGGGEERKGKDDHVLLVGA